MKEIPLTQGQVALVDDEDFALVSGYRWHARKNGRRVYAMASIKLDGKKTTIYMHRLISNAPPGYDVDHRDGDGLHNFRSNLRVCTRSENMMNRGATTANTSGFKGVSLQKDSGMWEAKIKVNYHQTNLGRYDTPEAAAAAYRAAAVIMHGEFANAGDGA